MAFCPKCGTRLGAASRFCPACGVDLDSASQMPTEVAPPARAAGPTSPMSSSAPIGRLDTASGGGGFAPGEVLAGRYRIIGLLGRGGMGEVYRADDLRLGQPVSLKFLPRSFASRPALLERFNAEVRLARQVSHPNVCRVYDIGEIDGQSFLTMEYVDGEDLATLLRRIGHLPAGKANEVSRQLCAGLAAAHEKGVLHRDLKPSNVMIDGEGRVRITDFGLAIRSDDATATDTSGTPAYMAPEQFEGGAVTARSDIYSLGLILYEVYTGHRPFEATSPAEWRNRHVRAEPTAPSAVDGNIDDAVERAILRCLEKDPSRRPSSALQLAAALPGGNPLAEALAAGETPSPEMVAAAGGEGALAPRQAWALLAAVLIVFAGILAVSPYSTDLGLAPFTKSADVLRDRARGVLAGLGMDRKVRDSDGWLTRNYPPMRWLSRTAPSTEWRAHMRRLGPPVAFIYRDSPRWMAVGDGNARVRIEAPPHELSDMATVALDANGALLGLRIVPPQIDSIGVAAPVDWQPLFRETGLDFTAFHPAPPKWAPLEPYDTRAEWIGPGPVAPLRVVAGAFRGRPVYFEVLGPWFRPSRLGEEPPSTARQVSNSVGPALLLIVIFAGVLFARRNLRLGRGDRRGAVRLGLFQGICALLSWAAGAHHVGDFSTEVGLLITATAGALFGAIMSTVLYLAFEPYVRRHVPELLIGWARLLEGRWRDPRVGRDVLVGALAGGVMSLGLHVTNALPTWIPFQGQTTIYHDYDALYGGRRLLAFLFGLPRNTLTTAIVLFCAFFVMRVAFRNLLAARIGLVMVAVIVFFGGENFALETPNALLSGLIAALVIWRFGLLAAVATFLFMYTPSYMPLPVDLTLPYGTSSAALLLLLAMIVLYAFRVSLGGRRPIAIALDDAA